MEWIDLWTQKNQTEILTWFQFDTDETARDIGLVEQGVQAKRTDSTKEICLQECVITFVVFIKHIQCIQ